MNIEEYWEYCLSIKGVTESFPFDEHTLVYKIMDKMFTFAPLNPKEGRFWADTKCDTTKSTELMEQYSGISFGPYSDKKYWITMLLDGSVGEAKILDFLDMSYDLIDRK